MGNPTTLAQLRTRVTRQADMQAQTGTSGFLTPDEINGYINDSLTELHDILILRYADYFVRKFPFTLTAGVEDYLLPDDFYKLRALYSFTGTGQRRRIYSFMEEEREALQMGGPYGTTTGSPDLAYRISDGVISFAPPPATPVSMEMRYVYQAPVLLNDSDKIEYQVVLGWEEYIVVDAAIKCRDKGELSTDRLNARKLALYKRIETCASDRDVGAPQRVADVCRGRWGWAL